MEARVIPIDDAVGMVIPHDLTEIILDLKKGPAFRKGHVIRPEDISHLKRIGKERIYVLTLGEDELHEDDAALLMARAIAGPNIIYDERPTEGKVGFRAACDGLFRVDVERLAAFNRLGEVMLATRHTHIAVKAGEHLAGERAIPLVVPRAIVDQAVEIASRDGGLIAVEPWRIRTGAVVITGREVFEGRVQDAFGPIMRKKLKAFGLEVISTVIVPDDRETIARAVRDAMAKGAGIILCTGGMSVDPDDVTRLAIADAGAKDVVYGSPVLPGAMFLAGYLPGDIPVLGVPACGMYYRTTVLDLVLPRVLAGERMDREKIAALGHGGLCLSCPSCTYPVCPFGKG